MTKFAIGSDGMITGTFSNGKTAVMGQLVLANFANTQGLVRSGQNDFTATLSSGQAVIGVQVLVSRHLVAARWSFQMLTSQKSSHR